MNFNETKQNSIISKVLYLQKTFVKLCEERLKPYKLTNGLYIYLIYINKYKECSMSHISKSIGKNKAYVTRAIKKLEELGYIEKEQNNDDLRHIKLKLTYKSIVILQEVEDLLTLWDKNLANELSEEEYDKLLELLKKSVVIKSSVKSEVCVIEDKNF